MRGMVRWEFMVFIRMLSYRSETKRPGVSQCCGSLGLAHFAESSQQNVPGTIRGGWSPSGSRINRGAMQPDARQVRTTAVEENRELESEKKCSRRTRQTRAARRGSQ